MKKLVILSITHCKNNFQTESFFKKINLPYPADLCGIDNRGDGGFISLHSTLVPFIFFSIPVIFLMVCRGATDVFVKI